MSDTIRLGDLEVQRMGYGAMRLPGDHVWGEPKDPDEARRVLRRVVELGINFIDTSWYYGPHVANRLIAEVLHPYPKDLVIATKLGGKRLPDKSWAADTTPEGLRKGHETDLQLLRREAIDVVHFRFIPSPVPFEESFGTLVRLQEEGKIRHLGVSNVTVAQLETALKMAEIVTVQNLFNLVQTQTPPVGGAVSADESDKVLAICEQRKIAFLPYFPLAMGALGKPHPAVAGIAQRHGVKPAQVALAWLMDRSPVMLPIPGTSKVAHLEENWEARKIRLTEQDRKELAEVR